MPATFSFTAAILEQAMTTRGLLLLKPGQISWLAAVEFVSRAEHLSHFIIAFTACILTEVKHSGGLTFEFTNS